MRQRPVGTPTADAAAPSAPAAAWWQPWRWFPAQWRAIDATSRPGAGPAIGTFERWLLVVAVLVMVGQRFPASGNHLARLVGESSTWFVLADDLQWALGSAAFYVLLPVVHLRLAGRSLRDGLNLGVAGTGRHLGVYLAMLALMVAPVLVVAASADFQRIYPFYPLAGRSWIDLVAWELAYAAQFVGLEVFFRGYLLEGLRRPLGSGAIFVMCVPYVMLHFGKTGLESLAALVAGLVLGTLAMRWRSIWGGALLHVGVAWTMDAVRLVQDGALPPPTLTP